MSTDTRPVSDTFSDRKDRAWRVRLTLGVLETVRRETGVRLADVIRGEKELAAFLYGDPTVFGQVTWFLVADQAAAAGVTVEDFYGEFDGSTLEAAGEAVLAAVADFFPRSAVARQLKADFRATLDELDRRVVGAAREASRRALSMSSGSAGGSAASPA